jgi:general secretion pathway protein A
MYLTYWKLRERPFANLPDLRFAFKSAAFVEGIARLRYAVREDKGLALLTGPIGSGKTYLLEKLREELVGEGDTVLRVVNPNLKAHEMLLALFNALRATSGLRFEGFDRDNKTDLLEALTITARERMRAGQRMVVVIDDAQTITEPLTVEELRLLLNHVTASRHLVQMVFAGQSMLSERLAEFPALCQRVDVSFEVAPLGVEEVGPYVAHRLGVAGAGERASTLFTPEALAEVYGYSRGVPRLVNNVCDMALLVACGEGLREVDAASVIKAAEDRPIPASTNGL